MKLPWTKSKKKTGKPLQITKEAVEQILSTEVSDALEYKVRIALEPDEDYETDSRYLAYWYEPRTRTNWPLRGFWMFLLPKYEDRQGWVEGAVVVIRRHEALRVAKVGASEGGDSVMLEAEVIREAILEDILAERGKQDKKWGEQNHENAYWAAILGEEFGEACKEVVEDYSYGRLRKELVQVATVAVAWLECLDRRIDANR